MCGNFGCFSQISLKIGPNLCIFRGASGFRRILIVNNLIDLIKG